MQALQMPSIGVDVAKYELCIAAQDDERTPRTVENKPAAILAWLSGLSRSHRIGMESTGSYWYALAELASAAGHEVYVINPRDLRHYAKAVGVRGKTDRVDAECIARYLRREHPQLRVWRAPSAEQRRLAALLRRRTTVTAHRAALRLAFSEEPALESAAQQAMAALGGLLKAIDRLIAQCLRTEPEIAEGVARLQTIVGIGPQNAVNLAALFARVPFANSDAVVAFVGFDPRAHDSGNSRGRRRLSKRGPGVLRQLLYIGAMSASKCAQWRPLYESLRARGLATTQALVVLARKLLRVAFAVWRSRTTFDPNRLGFVTDA